MSLCETISNSKNGKKANLKKQTNFTDSANVVTTINNISAVRYFLKNHINKCVAPSVFSQEPLENFLAKPDNVSVANSIYCANDIIVVGKVQSLPQLVKHHIILPKRIKMVSQCFSYEDKL